MDLQKAYSQLLSKYGMLGWWPADTPFEVCVGAILTQQTTWANVEKALGLMKEEDVLSCEKIAVMSLGELERFCFSTGFYRQKSKRLQGFCQYVVENYGGDEQKLLGKPLDEARAELLSLKGIGKETADSMLLYAGKHPIFVVDAYTHRLLDRWEIGADGDYDRAQELFRTIIPPSLSVYREYHALIVQHCKQVCRKKPLCSACVLADICAFASANKIYKCGGHVYKK